MEEYFSGDLDTKERVREEVIRTVKSRGGRFLEYHKDTGLWTEIHDNKVLHDKIYSGFYDHKKRLDARQETQATSCVTSTFLKDGGTFIVDGGKRRKLDCTGCWQTI